MDVTKGLLCIDLTEPVVKEAVKHGCSLIVAYHPPIFRPIERLTESDWKQRVIAELIRHDIAVYSPHTALDAAMNGMTDWLCEMIFSSDGHASPINPRPTHHPSQYKVAVFVPVDAETKVREAMSFGGAGQIGNYRECTFSAVGLGGFRPIKGAKPAIGKVGRRETVEERRLEMLVPRQHLEDVIGNIYGAHPYEEPTIDIYELVGEPVKDYEQTGSGRLVELSQPIAMKTVLKDIKQALGVPLKVANKNRRAIRTAAVCPGAGGSLFEGVEADLYITGEMQHHHVLDLVQQGRAVVLAGHTNTERPYLWCYGEDLKNAGATIPWRISKADKAPMQIV